MQQSCLCKGGLKCVGIAATAAGATVDRVGPNRLEQVGQQILGKAQVGSQQPKVAIVLPLQ